MLRPCLSGGMVKVVAKPGGLAIGAQFKPHLHLGPRLGLAGAAPSPNMPAEVQGPVVRRPRHAQPAQHQFWSGRLLNRPEFAGLQWRGYGAAGAADRQRNRTTFGGICARGPVQTTRHLAHRMDAGPRWGGERGFGATHDTARPGSHWHAGAGRWNGLQVVPADWLTASFTSSISTPYGGRYGYHWYLGAVARDGGAGKRDGERHWEWWAVACLAEEAGTVGGRDRWQLRCAGPVASTDDAAT
jgi:hypothetical protein